jgi:hypothetical protein
MSSVRVLVCTRLCSRIGIPVRRRWRDRDLIPFLPKFKRSGPGEWPDFWHICRF